MNIDMEEFFFFCDGKNFKLKCQNLGPGLASSERAIGRQCEFTVFRGALFLYLDIIIMDIYGGQLINIALSPVLSVNHY